MLMNISRAPIISLIFLTSFSVGLGQTQSQGVHRVSWKLEPLGLEANQPIVVDVGQIQKSSRWLLGVRIQREERGPSISAVSVETAKVDVLPGRSYIKNVTSLPSSVFQRQTGGKLTFVPIGAGQEIYALYIAAPVKTHVTVNADARIVFAGDVTESLLLDNGGIIAGPLQGLQSMMMHITHPQQLERPTGVVKAGERYVATSSALKEHLIDFSLPASMPSIQAQAAPVPIGLTIDVDQSGHVTRVAATEGAQPVLDRLRPYIQQWKFRPFTWEGKPVAVHARLVFLPNATGTLRGPVNVLGESAGASGKGDSQEQPLAASCCEKGKGK